MRLSFTREILLHNSLGKIYNTKTFEDYKNKEKKERKKEEERDKIVDFLLLHKSPFKSHAKSIFRVILEGRINN